MKIINIVLVFIIFVSFSFSVNGAYVKVSSLGHEKYGVELCYHVDNNCSYYMNNESFYLNPTKDYIIKIIHEKKDHSYGKSIYTEVFKTYNILAWFILIMFFAIMFYNIIKLK